jgi:hypothetical protein
MGTVIKLKRKITEDPVDCIIIECKKSRLACENGQNNFDLIKKVLNYAGSAKTEVSLCCHQVIIHYYKLIILINERMKYQIK